MVAELKSYSSDECDGAGEGKAVNEGCVETTGAGADGAGAEALGEDCDGATLKIPAATPWAANALTTASQPRSRVLMRSLSSSFSRSRSFSLSARR